jgi:parvulin-like peptidyl-prolyl isomerase
MLGWKDATGAQRLADPRAMKRTKADADKLATEILGKARKGADFAKLMQESSEDPGSRNSGKTFDVEADSPLPFAKLALRLEDNEVGLIESPFGWHVVKRLAPSQPDALDSRDILKRDPFDRTQIKHILLGWKDVHTEDPRGIARDRATLEKLVKTTLARLKSGEKFEALMAELSEDPESAKSGKAYIVDGKAQLVKPLKDLGLRLRLKEVGVVKSEFGIHIVERIE